MTDAYSWEEVVAKRRSYSEMLAEAKKIHPDMQVRLDEIYHEKWEMFMPTDFTENIELSEKYKGTAAWEMYENPESGYGSELERYRHKQGFDHVPLDGLAEYINLRSAATLAYTNLLSEMLQMMGMEPIETIDLDAMEEQVRVAYWKRYSKVAATAKKQVNEEFESREQALKQEFNF